MKLKTLIGALFLALSLNLIRASSYDDIVEYLPEMGEFKDFRLYSGYLDIKGNI